MSNTVCPNCKCAHIEGASTNEQPAFCARSLRRKLLALSKANVDDAKRLTEIARACAWQPQDEEC